METLVLVFSKVKSSKKCSWLEISTNIERKYTGNLTNCEPQHIDFRGTAKGSITEGGKTSFMQGAGVVRPTITHEAELR